MKSKRKSITVSTVNDYLTNIFAMAEADGLRCYRGHGSNDWTLKPSILRNYKCDAESNVINELMQEVPEEFLNETNMLGKLVKAQHYSLPTRLLDVSLNPLVGLYFACEVVLEEDEITGGQVEKDGAVVIVDFIEERIKRADSDTISLVTNLAHLSDEDRKTLYDKSSSDSVRSMKGKKAFRNLPEMKRLTQFVRTEKPYFSNSVQPIDLRKYYFVHPTKSNKRVIAQSGAFMVAGLLQFVAPQRSQGFSLKQIVIPANKKSFIREQLDVLNINSRSLFPEIEKVSSYIGSRWRTENE